MGPLFRMELACSHKQWIPPDIDAAFLPQRAFFPSRPPRLLPQPPLRSSLCVSCSSSARSGTKDRKRSGRAFSRTDEELRKEIQDFLSSRGLPLDKAPSTKELANCGRVDLANIVRRRGYRAIEELLRSPIINSNITKDNESIRSSQDDIDRTAIATAVDIQKIEQDADANEQDADSSDCRQPMSSICSPENAVDDTEDRLLNIETDMPQLSNESLFGRYTDEDLLRRAAEFVKTGKLDQSEDDEDVQEEEEENGSSFEDSSDEDEIGEFWSAPSTAEAIAIEKAAKLRAKLSPFLRMNVNGKSPDELSNEQIESDALDNGNAENQYLIQETKAELQRIKMALRKKEIELSEMSRELEEAKAQLALVQAKAAAEVAQAQQVVIEKEIHLKSANRALANLKQVQVEYWGEGSVVELAGSFNGWDHFVSLKPDLTSEIQKPDGSRGPMMWEAELWLYPGIYEIKFIVDGDWLIDHRREIATRNAVHNNVLRVDP